MYVCNVILFPTDFSKEADQAFQLVCSIARDHVAKVVVVHVIPYSYSSSEGSETDRPIEDQPAIRHFHEQFERLKELASGVPLTFRLETGCCVGTILTVAKQEAADLIVVASHRQSQFHLQLHGSVADGLLRQAHCSVLCLRQPNPGFRNVASDQSKTASGSG